MVGLIDVDGGRISVSRTDKIYSNEGNSFLLNLVPIGVRKVLDVGCGAGDNAKLLQGRGILIDGLTLAEKEADLARQWCRVVSVWDLEQGLPVHTLGLYDCIICSHVVEHLCFPDALLRDIRSVLAIGGTLIVAIPNLLFYKNRWKLLCGVFEYESEGLMDETHFKWYTYKSAQDLLRRHGYDVVSASAEGAFPLWPFRKLLATEFVQWIDAFWSRRFPGLFGYQFVFVCRLRS